MIHVDFMEQAIFYKVVAGPYGHDPVPNACTGLQQRDASIANHLTYFIFSSALGLPIFITFEIRSVNLFYNLGRFAFLSSSLSIGLSPPLDRS